MKFYLCKYIPSRTDFLATMTADVRLRDQPGENLSAGCALDVDRQ